MIAAVFTLKVSPGNTSSTQNGISLPESNVVKIVWSRLNRVRLAFISGIWLKCLSLFRFTFLPPLL